MRKNRKREKGVALILAIMLVLVLSLIGVSIMFISNSETLSSMNYRTMTQSRYGAESGLNRAANFIVNSYAPPTAFSGDAISAYDTSKSPVQYGGKPVVLSSGSDSNYPVAAVINAFQNTTYPWKYQPGSNSPVVNYAAKATLMTMQQVSTVAGPKTIQTWLLTGIGTIDGVRAATVQVTGTLERPITYSSAPGAGYGAFGMSDQCSALSFGGGGVVASYDSQHATLVSGTVKADLWGGNIGSNGNLNENGNTTTVYGTFSTPLTGVGSCSNGNNGASDAWTNKGNATVTGCSTSATECVSGGIVTLSQTVVYETPALPNPLPPTTDLDIGGNSTCSSVGLVAAPAPIGKTVNCIDGASKGSITILPGTYGNINIGSGANVTFQSGTYAVNSVTEKSANSTVTVQVTNSTNPAVTLNVAGTGTTTPIDLTGNSIVNATSGVPVPGNLLIEYAGSGTIKVTGGTGSAAVVYAPKAEITLSGNATFYGALIGNTVKDTGGAMILYDRQLNKGLGSTPVANVGNYMLTSFSWSRF